MIEIIKCSRAQFIYLLLLLCPSFQKSFMFVIFFLFEKFVRWRITQPRAHNSDSNFSAVLATVTIDPAVDLHYCGLYIFFKNIFIFYYKVHICLIIFDNNSVMSPLCMGFCSIRWPRHAAHTNWIRCVVALAATYSVTVIVLGCYYRFRLPFQLQFERR